MVLHQDRDEEMIPSLLQFKHHLDTILTTSFSSNDLFSQSLRESFEFFINRRRDKPAEYIAKYLDNLLRKGDKGLTTDATLEEEMDRVLILFRFVHGKDVFEAFYKKDLAKRLLLGKSASADAERSMLAKLKNGMDPSLSDLSSLRAITSGVLWGIVFSCSQADNRMWCSIHSETRRNVQRYRHLSRLYKIIQRPKTRHYPRKRSPRQRPLSIMVAHIPRQTGPPLTPCQRLPTHPPSVVAISPFVPIDTMSAVLDGSIPFYLSCARC